MDFKYKQLEHELTALSRVFGELGARLSEVAKEVTSPGVSPSEKLIEQISTARANFDNVRNAVHGHAATMLVSPLPKIGEVVSITAVDTLLKASAAAEENKLSIETERERALGILSRVLAITHKEINDFKPLQECHAKVDELRSGIAKVAWPHRHPESESVIASKHPFTTLLSFVENLETLEDDRWIALETTITETFGKPLFVAASRGKLLAPKPAAVERAAVPAPAPAPAVEKPVEKKMAAEKAPEKPAAPVAAPAPAAQVDKKVTSPAPAPPPVAAAPVKPAAPPAAATEKKDSVERPHAVPAPPQPPAPAAVPVTVNATPAPTPAVPAAVAQPAVQAPPAPPAAPAPPIAAIPATPAPTVPAAAGPAAPTQRPPAVTPASAPVTTPVPAPVPAVAATIPTPAAPAPIIAAQPAAAVTTAPTAQTNIPSLSALATATEPVPDRKVSTPAVETIDKQRKEPRLAAPAPQPVLKSEAKQQEAEMVSEQQAGDGQRPQRWGFWRGNR